MSEGEDKPREVAPAVTGVMAALKACAEKFREWEADTVRRAFGDDGATAEFRGMAEMCEKAIADLEAMLEPQDLGPKPKAPPSPSMLFRIGYDHGAMQTLWNEMSDEAREKMAAEGKGPPPGDWQAAWAVTRALIASGQEAK